MHAMESLHVKVLYAFPFDDNCINQVSRLALNLWQMVHHLHRYNFCGMSVIDFIGCLLFITMTDWNTVRCRKPGPK
jgi:hypothetical protein